jgi:hypothetical protein
MYAGQVKSLSEIVKANLRLAWQMTAGKTESLNIVAEERRALDQLIAEHKSPARLFADLESSWGVSETSDCDHI